MSVTLQTDVGDIKIEVFCERTPKTCENFLALCASNYYNGCVFHRNIKGFMVQTGDPTGTGRGGSSIWGRKFEDEYSEYLKVQPVLPVDTTVHTDVIVSQMPHPWHTPVIPPLGKQQQADVLVPPNSPKLVTKPLAHGPLRVEHSPLETAVAADTLFKLRTVLIAHCSSSRVIDGLETLDELEKLPVNEKTYRPLNDVHIKDITIHANPFAQ
ncbi:peptidyl-prolyl cis-trans isomerase-like 3 [Alexandromys fortis]|uniref:peptidyl-prolyl cis-trans isomerase-like 3 n=1 Tax=Alexandromys fortis TaxID=100897 RepID=UPI0021539DA1|nr:peptidyl-prolyl cis-trans isomerase-like 3 [Microtus fortis]